jgi:hypothetical protein
MTPKEKAIELLNKYNSLQVSFYKNQDPSYGYAKQCALIAVNEIILAMDNVMLPNPFKQYWNKVKQEIQAL